MIAVAPLPFEVSIGGLKVTFAGEYPWSFMLVQKAVCLVARPWLFGTAHQ